MKSFSILLFCFLFTLVLSSFHVSSKGTRLYVKEYFAHEKGFSHFIDLNENQEFKLTIYPKNWISCWNLISYSGNYSLIQDTLIFNYTFHEWNLDSNRTFPIESREVFVLKKNKNIHKISGDNVFFDSYKFRIRRDRVQERFNEWYVE